MTAKVLIGVATGDGVLVGDVGLAIGAIVSTGVGVDAAAAFSDLAVSVDAACSNWFAKICCARDVLVKFKSTGSVGVDKTDVFPKHPANNRTINPAKSRNLKYRLILVIMLYLYSGYSAVRTGTTRTLSIRKPSMSTISKFK